MNQTLKTAHRLFDNWNTGAPYETMAGAFAMASVDEAYAVQAALQQLHTTKRGAIAGRKIALSSKTMQQMIGLDEPIAGAFFGSDVHHTPATIRLDDFVRLGIEFELALELKANIAPRQTEYTHLSARELVAGVRPAFELIEDRNADYSRLDAHTLIADNAWCGGVVLGEPVADWQQLDLGNIASRVVQPGQPDEATNTGAADPLGSLAWVLNHFSARGIALSKGEHIITGSAVRTRFPVSGDRLAYDVAGATVDVDLV
ncbi:MAG: 2-keto-4-pentenoate hydratase [Rhizobiaceae bacterium]